MTSPCSITSDLAVALYMVPECLLPVDAGEPPHFRDEHGGGWFWIDETFREPVRAARPRVVWYAIRIPQHPTHDQSDDCA
jgi:hypothetical protein